MPENYSEHRMDRFERKLDQLGDNLTKLAVIDERMLQHMTEQKRMSERQEIIERRLDKIDHLKSRLIGAAGVVSLLGSGLGPVISKLLTGG